MFERIILEKEDGIALIRFNRPEVLNVLDSETERELVEAINEISRDDATRVLIITGTGRAFCAGGDVKVMGERTLEEAKAHLIFVQQVISGLVNMEKPVIAAINGFAMGAGWCIALACDILIASESAKFSQAFINVGLLPDMGGMYFLPRMAGLAKAKELMFTGAVIDAKEAHEIGVVNRVVPEKEVEEIAKELARKIASASQKPIALMKRILNQSDRLDLPSLFELETEAQAACEMSDEHKKLAQAFMDRKKKI